MTSLHNDVSSTSAHHSGIPKFRGGIKHPNFCHPHSNGVSHAKNKVRKKARYLKNRAARADVNREYQGDKGWNMPGMYFSLLNALSAGTAA